MYSYVTTFIIVFLTHPGVIYNFFDPGVAGGIFHATMVLLLQSPSDGKASFANTMALLYWIALGIWAYVKVRMMLMAGR